MNREHCFYIPFLRDWYKVTKKYEKRIQTSVDNAVNDRKIAFFSYILLLETYFFKIPKDLITLAFYLFIFLPWQILKKHTYPSANTSAFADCRGDFRTLHW